MGQPSMSDSLACYKPVGCFDLETHRVHTAACRTGTTRCGQEGTEFNAYWESFPGEKFEPIGPLDRLDGDYAFGMIVHRAASPVEPVIRSHDGCFWPLLRYQQGHWSRDPHDTRWVPWVQHYLYELARTARSSTIEFQEAACRLALEAWGAPVQPTRYLHWGDVAAGTIVQLDARPARPHAGQPQPRIGFPAWVSVVNDRYYANFGAAPGRPGSPLFMWEPALGERRVQVLYTPEELAAGYVAGKLDLPAGL